MRTVIQTETFAKWLSRLKDRRAAARISSRLLRVEDGHLGDVKSVGDGVSEMRIDYGQGYRLYFTRSGVVIIVLLCGGDKSTQRRDIIAAQDLAKAWREDQG